MLHRVLRSLGPRSRKKLRGQSSMGSAQSSCVRLTLAMTCAGRGARAARPGVRSIAVLVGSHSTGFISRLQGRHLASGVAAVDASDLSRRYEKTILPGEIGLRSLLLLVPAIGLAQPIFERR
jgi:hypothetical protein